MGKQGYEEFLAPWKNADGDRPETAIAKRFFGENGCSCSKIARHRGDSQKLMGEGKAEVTGSSPRVVADGRIVMKVVFVLFRRADLTHEQSLAEWNGEKHISTVRMIPGLKRWVQNHVTTMPSAATADGVGELWFESATAMEQAMNSPQMASAVEDAKRFLDLERTYAVIVDEKTVIE